MIILQFLNPPAVVNSYNVVELVNLIYDLLELLHEDYSKYFICIVP